jgi:DNA-binding response OmpR family regulator
MDQMLEQGKVDLVIPDLVMPDEGGLILTRRLHESHNTAIIILTLKDDMVDRVVRLEMGANNYITKPFSTRELHARVKSVLRRTRAEPPPDATAAAKGNTPITTVGSAAENVTETARSA